MNPGRLEAFSDGVLAIIITIMILELKTPLSSDFHSLIEIIPHLLAYILSYLYVGIYWNNHHLLKTIKTVDGKLLWANMMWVFSISLIPFTTAWMSKFYTDTYPVMSYSIVMILCAISYLILQNQALKQSPQLKIIFGKDYKGKVSLITYIISLILAFFYPSLSIIAYILVALIWLIPDKRIEKALTEK